MFRGFDAFGDHFQAEVVRQVDHGVHQLAVFFAQLHAADKAFVDLEQRNRQAVEVHERREAGAKIIQRKTHTQPTQRIHRLFDQIAAAHDGSFGQFEFQPAGIDAPLGDQAAQGRQQLTVLKLAERQVDRHVQCRQPEFAQRLHVAQGAGNDPVTQRHDQTALLGQGYKLAGWQQSTLGVAPAYQGFEANDAPVVQ